MRSNTHTPGPWWWDGGRYIYGADWPDQGYVAEVNPLRSNNQCEPDGEANARLIAAAPELRHWVAEVLERCMLDDRAREVAKDLEREAYTLLAQINGKDGER